LVPKIYTKKPKRWTKKVKKESLAVRPVMISISITLHK